MIPLLLCIVLYVYVSISGSIREKTSLSYNVLNLNTAQVEKVIDGGVSPDYIEKGDEDDEYSMYLQTDQCGWTPLMVATYHGDFDMIKLLVGNGADIHAVDYCGFNVIDIVADYLGDESGYEILNYYLDKGVDPNNVTNYHQDAVWLAARNRKGSNTSI